MKKLLTLLALISLSASSLKAQTFDETVEYISTLVKDNKTFHYSPGYSTGNGINKISAGKDGKIVFFWVSPADPNVKETAGSVNLFDVAKFDIYSNGFTFRDVDGKSLGYLSSMPDASGNRLKKAFEHLRTLCDKSADPFAE